MSIARFIFCALTGIFYGLAFGCVAFIFESIYWLYMGRNLFLWGIISLGIMAVAFGLAADWCWMKQKDIGKWG